MIIILPKTNSGMNDLDKIIDYDNYLKILKTLKYESVDLSIPKFKITNEFPLKETLKSISMKISFSNYADFSGMTGRKDFKIDNVIHKAFVDVSEEGTEAAAATAVIMTKSSSMPLIKNKIFKADHPFLFLIKDNETESILFIGKILNPIL
jgi:serpin B